ncbi:MAG: hypothetical protein ABI640_11710 [Gammaproteobacteria bacterium]
MNAKRILLSALCALVPAFAFAQGRFGTPPPPAGPPKTAREAAPVDLTGTWVSIVSEDWRWRMLTPTRGDFQSIPLNAEGKKVGMAWDATRDEMLGLQCKSFGAPALLRVPGRVRISWQDDETLKIETDAGMQTRLLHFKTVPGPVEDKSWQGYAVANWERPLRSRAASEGFALFSGAIGRAGRSLEVVTTNLREGYYRRNGPPYSADTKLEEYFDHHKEPNGDEWFTVTTVVTDPKYLTGVFVTSTDFKKQKSAAGWDPTPCTSR